jgi:methylmalonyl-CoA decarboxylase
MHRISTTLAESVACVTFDDPRSRNALSEALIGEMITAFGDLQRRQARAIVLRARPGVSVWSAGHNVRELPEGRRDPLGWHDPLRTLVRAVQECSAPIIALLEGGVWGGACEVALACDVLVATPNTTFAITPAKLGVPYNASGLLTFMNAIPLALLKEMAFTADPVGVERALSLGIVNHVVAADQIEGFTFDLARRIAANAPLSISVMKEQMRLLLSAYSITPSMFERLQGLRRVVYDSRDYREGIRAFLEKRTPDFMGE